MPSVIETLKRGRERYAECGENTPASYYPSHGKVCALTALRPLGASTTAAIDELRKTIGRYSIADYNAEHTQAEVLAVFDKTIERLIKES